MLHLTKKTTNAFYTFTTTFYVLLIISDGMADKCGAEVLSMMSSSVGPDATTFTDVIK